MPFSISDNNNKNKHNSTPKAFASHLWNRVSKPSVINSSTDNNSSSSHESSALSRHNSKASKKSSSSSTMNSSKVEISPHGSTIVIDEAQQQQHQQQRRLTSSSQHSSSSFHSINPQYSLQPKPRTKHSISDDYSLDPKSEVSTPSTGISSNTESAGTSPNSKPHDSTQTLKLDNHEIKGKVDSNIALSGSNAESSQPLSVMDTDPVIVLKEYTSGTVSPEAKRHHSVATSLSRNSAVSRKTINRLQYEKFYNFLANSRESDALVYSLTRKEAWIQYNGPRQSDKRTLEIVELWTMMALRYLLQNRLIYSPPALKCLQNFKSRTKLREQSGNGSTILDIQGLFKDHWGWQLALDFQQATVYGVRIDPQQTFPDSDLNYEGPPNYIPCVAHSIGSLPFDDDFFDVVCARTLWYLIRSDQWNSAFKEIMRVLKPGGVLELVNSDYDVINGNPDEDGRWWARLKKACLLAHIDPNPSATAARKLIDTGFLDINRAMIALPREWGGQIGNLTDFLFLYYFDSLYQAFGLMDPSEVEEFRRGSKAARIKGYCSCGNITLFYCTKPLKENNC